MVKLALLSTWRTDTVSLFLYKDGEVSIPDDTLVVDLTRNGVEVDEIGQPVEEGYVWAIF